MMLITAAFAVAAPGSFAGRTAELAVSGRSNANASIAASGRRVALGRGISDGKGSLRFLREVIRDDARAAYPVVAAADDAVVIAWTSGPAGQSVLRVERVPF